MKSGPITLTCTPLSLSGYLITISGSLIIGWARAGKVGNRVTRAEKMSGYLVKRAQSVIHLSLEEIVSKHGLGIPHYVVLTLLAESPGLSNDELARNAFVT